MSYDEGKMNNKISPKLIGANSHGFTLKALSPAVTPMKTAERNVLATARRMSAMANGVQYSEADAAEHARYIM